MQRRARPGSTVAPAQLVAAAWLSDQSLVAVVSPAPGVDEIRRAVLLHDGSPADCEVASMNHPAPGPPRAVAVLRAERPMRQLRLGLSLSMGGTTARFDPVSVSAATTDLRSLIRSQFTSLPPDQRGEVVRFLVSSSATSPEFTGDHLRESRSLHVAREMLRERLPRCELSATNVEGLVVEAVLRITDTDFYVEGWICDVESAAARLTAVSPEGARTDLLDGLFRCDRPDVQAFFKPTVGAEATARCGFIAYFHIDAPSRLPSGWVFEMETAAGTSMEVAAPPVVTADERTRAKLLADVSREIAGGDELRRLHISPALSRLQARRSSEVRVDRDVVCGKPPPSPDVSVIVPLYGRMDFMEHQVAQFAGDPDLHRSELIYVIDSPERAADAVASAQRLFRLYGLPMRVLTMNENAGFSLANNVAASVARGRLLVLLNSDVLPRAAGWLSSLRRAHDALDSPGAVGPMLLYEDDSVQHAGLYFDRPAHSRMWNNEHYFKGLHMELPAANVAREVPAVTAACLMVDADLFRQVGGLSGAYVQGDYEDSDLCLRLRDAGRKSWYVPQVKLYHLEAQSYPSELRNLNREYNRWLFNETWSDEIEKVTAELAGDREPKKARTPVMRQSEKAVERQAEVVIPS